MQIMRGKKDYSIIVILVNHLPDVVVGVVGVVLGVVVGVVVVDGVLSSVVDLRVSVGGTASVLLATKGTWVVPA